MARKLYIFNQNGKAPNESKPSSQKKWLGRYSTDYAYLGDFQARLLGVGHALPGRRVPQWLHMPALADRSTKGGASRHDRDFRGWG